MNHCFFRASNRALQPCFQSDGVLVALRKKNATQGIYGRTVGAEKEEGNKAGCNLHLTWLIFAGLVFLFLPV